MTDENNQIKIFLYENWARTKTGQHTVAVAELLIVESCTQEKRASTSLRIYSRFALSSSTIQDSVFVLHRS